MKNTKENFRRRHWIFLDTDPLGHRVVSGSAIKRFPTA